jgi:hypothetical protein
MRSRAHPDSAANACHLTAVPACRLTARYRTAQFFLTAALALAAIPAAAQLPDPYVIPRGVLRLGFAPVYTNFDRLFDADGSEFSLGSLFATDSLGSTYLVTLAAAEEAVRSLAGDPAFRFHAGAVRARVDADIRRLPFSLGIGLTRSLTFVATVPLVTTRVNATVTLDSTDATAGWNQAAATADAPDAAGQIAMLVSELDAAAATLEADIAAGAYGCPSSAQCDQARDLAARARAMSRDVTALAGLGQLAGGGPAPPFAPLASSPAGEAILAAVGALDAELQAFGLAPFAGTLPLPVERLPSDAVDQVLSGSQFGYDAGPLGPPETVKVSGVGDIELGLRLALAQRPALRAALGATIRLPTSKRDDPANFLDLPNGDRQIDLEWTLDAAIEPGTRLGLWLGAAYVLQLPDQVARRAAPANRPVALASTDLTVDRNLGDVLRVSAHPALRLAPDFRVFLSAAYERRGRDRYTQGGSPVEALEALTGSETWAFGAGMLYRLDRGRGGSALPIEASLAYQAAYYGTGGVAPKTGRVSLSLRLFYGLWGQPPAPAPEPTPAPVPSGAY